MSFLSSIGSRERVKGQWFRYLNVRVRRCTWEELRVEDWDSGKDGEPESYRVGPTGGGGRVGSPDRKVGEEVPSEGR